MSDEHGMLITAAFMHNEIRTPAGSSFDVYSSREVARRKKSHANRCDKIFSTLILILG